MRTDLGILLRLWFAEMTGQGAYVRYLAHHRHHHAGEEPLGFRDFHRAEEERKWRSIRRCC